MGAIAGSGRGASGSATPWGTCRQHGGLAPAAWGAPRRRAGGVEPRLYRRYKQIIIIITVIGIFIIISVIVV